MSSVELILRGPMLNPRPDGTVQFWPDGLLIGDRAGRIAFAGPSERLSFLPDPSRVQQGLGIICPPFLDNHIHIPQHPIRGRFAEGIAPNPPEGRLLAGLNRNVYPAEARCADPDYTRQVVGQFLSDTLAHGVIGGSAYMTVHTAAARIALEMLPRTWLVGPVLMNMNCPESLRTDEPALQRDIEDLAGDFGRRVVVTDRFAVTVNSELRRKAAGIASDLDLRMQTHLSEQLREKRLVEQRLYPHAGSYAAVYQRDGLLERDPILAHCIWMSQAELDLLAGTGGAVAHCPTSNTLLGSGVMPLDELRSRGIDYALCTDVGASPTTSILAEMEQFLRVHRGRTSLATPQEALYRATLGPARMLGFDAELGSFDVGKQMTFVEITCSPANVASLDVDAAIAAAVLELPPEEPPQIRAILEELRSSGVDDPSKLAVLERGFSDTVRRLDGKVLRVIVEGDNVFRRG